MDPVEPPAAAGEPSPGRVPGRTVVIVLGVGAALAIGLTLLGAWVVPQLDRRRQLRARVACAYALRRVHQAAAGYAADHAGAFPHARAPGELDGAFATPDGPRVWRLLLSGGYLDEPGDLLCPSMTRRRSLPAEVRAAQRAWLSGGEGEAPTGVELEDVSYGWTRRALTPSSPGDWPLAADEAVLPRGGEEVVTAPGNHVDGWNVARVDGAVTWVDAASDPFPGTWLTATEDPARDGYLGILPQLDPTLLVRESR